MLSELNDLVLPLVIVGASCLTSFLAVKFGLKQTQADVAELKEGTSRKDESHDSQLADHDKRIAVNEAKIEMQTGVLNDIKRKVDKLVDILVKKGNP